MEKKTENVVGALVLGLADAVLDEAGNHAPEKGQAAAAIALLRHEPGMTIEQLRRALGMSHPGAVRLVDRLAVDGLVARRPSVADKRAVALHLTEAGDESCNAILASRYRRIARALEVFDPHERETFRLLAEKLLTAFVEDVDHAYSVCRLCDTSACVDCPVTCSLLSRQGGAPTAAG
ncbi:MarR family winged helix-turn-helix transcriptional regulator [Ensifer sp.]|jgi:DNA-binding MarR family transcriptional regulator|uniref:MarR family winged helix-turn-helix transcriptional regulator n=1 Tax=Ensifer sp. TaxID=1872086 RepID=UPI002E13F5CC|nr:MarR family transcriptional regulator [Ensifer sp.]